MSHTENPLDGGIGSVEAGPRFNSGQHLNSSGPPRVAIKLSDHAKRAGDLHSILRNLLEKVARGASQNVQINRLITSQDEQAIADLIERAKILDPTYEPADFTAWFQAQLEPRLLRGPSDLIDLNFDLTKDTGVDAFVRHLQSLDEVDSAYALREGPPPKPTVNWANNPRSKNQGYQNAAPVGIDSHYAWNVPGSDGANTGFVDLEQGWNLNHEDLVDGKITLISGKNQAYFAHGTSVLGQVLMFDNTIGGVGHVPRARGRVISQHQPGGYNTAATILGAAAVMSEGDVLLLEAQETDPVSGKYYWPVSIVDANYDAIRLATALGITVVEAGCNGGYDLDAYVNLNGKHIFNRSSLDFRDPLSIMVGAGSSAAPHARLWFSNYGSRIDTYAWGENVDTASTNDTGTDNHAYTTSFNGTSSASPIIAGAALTVQGIAVADHRPKYGPVALRGLLSKYGTPSKNPASDRIGVMPDLKAIIANAYPHLKI